MYVDLIKNPEGFTGYAGESANRIWKAIYDANCFNSKYNRFSPEGEKWNKCVERRLFYRIISGLHSSVSCHIALRFWDSHHKKWIYNKKVFEKMLGNHKERIENLGFLHSILAKSIQFSSKIINNHDFLVESDVEREIMKVLTL